jgi:hypothetical protein
MLDQERVERDPVSAIDASSERRLGLFGRARADDPEAVRDAVDVRIHRDRGDPVAEDEHAVRGLRPDPGESDQLLERPRDLAVPSVEDDAGTGTDDLRLRVVEPRRADQPLHRP